MQNEDDSKISAKELLMEMKKAPQSYSKYKRSADDIIAELKKNPDKILTRMDVILLVDKEFPAAEKWPFAAEMDDAVLTTGEELPYRVNQWIERMGNDMIWHLEPIRRISRSVQSNDTTKYDYFYKTSCGVFTRRMFTTTRNSTTGSRRRPSTTRRMNTRRMFTTTVKTLFGNKRKSHG